MAHRLVLATRNQGKIEEFRRILDAQSQGAIELVGLETYPQMPDVEETGDTFEANALLKAHAISEFTGLPAIADDSGLCVDALDGAPGIFSARWAGVHGDDRANLEKVLQQLQDVPDKNRGAHFVCVAALVMPDGSEYLERAHFDGSILHHPVGENGFGYDPIFQPLGLTLSSAQLSAHEKDEMSHRGKALRAIAPRVISLLTSLG